MELEAEADAARHVLREERAGVAADRRTEPQVTDLTGKRVKTDGVVVERDRHEER